MQRSLSLLVLIALASPAMTGCLDRPGFFGGQVDPYDLLRDDDFQHWVIEIDYATGHRPSADAVSLLRSRLTSLVEKDRIDIIIDDAIPATSQRWTTGALDGLSDTHLDAETGDGTVVTHVLYVAGNSADDADDGRVLGLAIQHDLVVIFDETIESAANLLFSATTIERAVLVHEFGHILGLVDHGIPMTRPHSDGGSHSDNQNSVMYSAVDTTDVVQFFTGGIPTRFDADDKADICAAGGKC